MGGKDPLLGHQGTNDKAADRAPDGSRGLGNDVLDRMHEAREHSTLAKGGENQQKITRPGHSTCNYKP